MKTKIFALFLGMLCLITNALAQSGTLTGFNGRIKFTSFANNGLYVRGTLDDFLDQTNQYVASDIDSADVVWDNQGRRYLVHDVISSNLTQAVVDLSRIGGGTHIPTGVGFVSRETSNGLALVPPVNSTGISTQLASRVGVHNAKILEGLKTIYTGGDSIKVPTILVKFAKSQSIGFGNFADVRYPNYNTDYGLNISINENGSIGLFNGKSAFEAGGRYANFFANEDGYTIAGGGSGSGFGKSSQIQNAAYIYDPINFYRKEAYNLAGIYEGSGQFIRSLAFNLSAVAKQDPSVSLNPSAVNISQATATKKVLSMNLTSLRDTVYYAYLGNGDSLQYQGYGTSLGLYGINNDGRRRFKIAYNKLLGSIFDTGERNLFEVDFLKPNAVRMYDKYDFANATPSATNGAKTIHLLTGDGTTTTPSLLRIQNGFSSDSTDGSGDLTVTVPTMPDATYSTNITVEGTTSYTVSVHTKTTTSFKVRFFNPATGAAVISTSVSCSYHIQDY